MNEAIEMTKEHIVEVRITNPKKAGVYTLGDYWDDKEKKIRRLTWANGEPRTFKINGNAETKVRLNMNDENDKMLYDHIINHPVFVKTSKPLIEVVNIGEEVNKRSSFIERRMTAEGIIKDLMGRRLAAFARLFGIPTYDSSEKAVRLALYEIANHDPDAIIREWSDPDKDIKELIELAIDKGIFRVSAGVWTFNQVRMGTTKEQVVAYLKDKGNADVIEMLKRETEKIGS